MTEKRCKCLCGAVNFKVSLPEPKFDACHCSMCRRWASGPLLAVHAAIDSIEGGDNITSYPSSEWAERAFCKTCGTNLYYKITAEGPHSGATHVSVGIMDDISDMQLGREIFIEEKPAGYAFTDGAKQMTGAEVFAEVTSGSDRE